MKSRETKVEGRGRKIYTPVTDFERATSYCPLYLAWHILDEAREYFRTPIPEAFADKLARRAEAVFARHPFWQRKFKSQRGRDAILTSMRHWLAGVLARERPALFRNLPESFKIGQPLPQKQTGGAAAPPYLKTVGLTCRSAQILGTHCRSVQISKRRGSRGRSPHHPVSRFVHGCELLMI